MTKISKIPSKTLFSGKDYDTWGLYSVDFEPFKYQDDFAENINKIAKNITDEDLLETLQKAKGFACSTIILNKEGRPHRVFFDNPQNLKKFMVNYQEDQKPEEIPQFKGTKEELDNL